jgi:hypothetical protein
MEPKVFMSEDGQPNCEVQITQQLTNFSFLETGQIDIDRDPNKS